MRTMMKALALSLVVLALLAPSAARACTSPAGVAGEMSYNSDRNVMQYCNGTSWIAASNSITDSQFPSLSDGLVAWLKFDDAAGSGTAADSSGNNNPATIFAGGFNTTGGVIGGAYETTILTATDARINTSASISALDDTITIAFWLKDLGITNDFAATVQYGNPGVTSIIKIQKNGPGSKHINIRMDTSGGTNQNRGLISDVLDGSWHHIAYTLDNGTVRTYKDGVFISTQTYNHGTGFSNSSGINFSASANAPFAIDDLRVYNRVVTDQEIERIYMAGGDRIVIGVGRLSAGGRSSCALTPSGAARCWGWGGGGYLGNGGTTDSNTSVAVSGGLNFKSIAPSRWYTCGITFNDDVYCWGERSTYQRFGDGLTTDQTTPALAANGMKMTAISTGNDHMCGIASAGDAYCWGRNDDGQIGNGTTGGLVSFPTLVSGDYKWKAISAGTDHSCGITTGGDAYCWGNNGSGRLGNGNTTASSVPVLVNGGHKWASIVTGAGHSCGITTTGVGYCWGIGANGRLGHGGTAFQTSPIIIAGGYRWASLGTGYTHTCGVTVTGDGFCWGGNLSGEVGDNSTTQRNSPTPVNGSRKWIHISGGGNGTQIINFSCGLTTDGEVWCWGEGSEGQLGNGLATDSLVPVQVTDANFFGQTGCVNPRAAEGSMIYDETYKVMEYCDGRYWRSMGQATFNNAGRRQPVPAPDLAHWKMDTGGGTTLFDSVGTNNGTLNNGPVWVPVGKLGGAIEFDGTNDNIAVPDNAVIDLTGDFTISAWVKTIQPMAAGTYPIIVYKRDESPSKHGYAILLHTSNTQAKWKGEIYNAGTQYVALGATDIADGEWHHIVFIRSGSSILTYEDGVYTGNTTAAVSVDLSNASNLMIGGNTATDYMSGSVDDVRIYSTALSAAEVSALYQQGLRTIARPDLAWWTFDESAGPFARDMIGGHHGTLTNMNPNASRVTGKVGRALSFDGVDDYIVDGEKQWDGTWLNHTMMAWVKLDDFPANTSRAILSKGAGTPTGMRWMLFHGGTGNANHRIWFNNVNVQANTQIVNGTTTWQHLAVSIDGTNATFYRNGVADGSFPVTYGGDNDHPLAIGVNSSAYDNLFKGSIDDLRIYSRALTAAEVLAIYNLTNGTFQCTNPNGVEGELVYNTAHTRMQFCNNQEWIGIP